MFKRRNAPRRLRAIQRGFIALGIKGIGPAFDGQRPDPVAELFRQGEPGAVFIAQKPSDLYARRNLLTYSEQFDNAAWTRRQVTVTANSTLAPNGTVTADTITPTAVAGSFKEMQQDIWVHKGQVYTYSVYLKANGYSYVQVIGPTAQFGTFAVNFDLSNGTITASTPGNSTIIGSGINAAANGFYRLWVAVRAIATGPARLVFNVIPASDSARGVNWTPNGTSGVYAWGAQLERGSTATAYQRITDWTTEFLYQGRDFTRRNLLTYSQSFGNAVWTTVAATKASTTATAPDGTATALTLTMVASPSSRIEQSCTFDGTSNYVFSVYMRSDVPNAKVQYGRMEGPRATVTLTPTWTRYTIDLGVPAAGVSSVCAQGAIPPTFAGDIQFWGAQLEAGTIASDYQPVTDGSEFIPVVNPLITQWQDNLGTTPVTALEQTIGLQQDVRPIFGAPVGPNVVGQPLLGPELNTNPGPFTATTGYSGQVNVTLSLVGQDIQATLAGTSSTLTFRDLPTVAGTTYRAVAVVSAASGDLELRAYDGADFTTLIATNDNYVEGSGFQAITLTFKALGATTRIAIGQNGSSETYFIRGLSLKAIYGNHRSQATATARARLSARYNLLDKTQEFSDSYWTKTDATITSSNNPAPDGTNTAALVTEGSAGSADIRRAVTVGSGIAHTWSVRLKRGNTDWVRVQLADNTFTDNVRCWVNLATGEMGTKANTGGASGAASATIRALGSDWYEVKFTGTIGTFTNVLVQVMSAAADGSTARVTGATYYIWGADLRLSCYAHSGLPAYQHVWDGTAGVHGYDDADFPARIVYDGTDDWYSTGSIDASASNKLQTWCAFAKRSDSAYGVLFESSLNPNNFATYPGAFTIGAATLEGDGSRRTWGAFLNAGTALVGRGAYIYTSPDLRVMSVTFDSSQSGGTNEIGVRLNGTVPTLTNPVADAGTSNFGNYPLYFGARGAGSANFLSGDEFISIVRGGATPGDALIGQVEQFCARYAQLTF